MAKSTTRYSDVFSLVGGYNSFSDFFAQAKQQTQNPRYKDLPFNSIVDAFGKAWVGNPYVQNTRLKSLRSVPLMYTREQIETMLKSAEQNEQGLRQVSLALNYSSYPFYKLKRTMATIPTYRWTYLPQYVDVDDVKTKEYKRERRFIDKFCKKLKPSMLAEIIAQQSIDEGKVFRYVRYDVDKAHANVNAVALQELPSDFCKIVGRNSDSYYTVAFDFTYFWQPGANIYQFAPIFKDYLEKLMSITDEVPDNGKKRKVINMAKAAKLNDASIRIEQVSGRYFFWAELPTDECFVFGADFSSPLQAPMLMGLFLTAADLSQYEYLQKQLLQTPLYALLTGEIPYFDEKHSKERDDTRMSPTSNEYFRTIFYQMMNANDTSGVDVYFAPVENMKLQKLDDSPNATDIVTKAYQDFNTKAGTTGILSSTDKPMAALVVSSQKIESQFIRLIYAEFESMMNLTFERLNLKYSWRFMMFGDIFSDENRLKAAKEGMTLGILPDAYIYNALLGRTIEDDIAASYDMAESGILDYRIPLKTSYTASGNADDDKPTGRPSAQIEDVISEKTEESIDQGDGTNI